MKQWMESTFSGLVLVSMFAWTGFHVVKAMAITSQTNWQLLFA